MGRAWLVKHKDNTNHFTGVGLFCLGSFLYSLGFLELAGRTHEHLRRVHQALRWFLLLSTLALVVVFVLLWAIEETSGAHAGKGGPQTAYIFEHVAYITQILFYATFFLYHSPKLPPEYSLDPAVPDDREDGTRLLARPIAVAITPPLLNQPGTRTPA